MKKIFQLMLGVAIAVVLVSCAGHSSSNKQSFWEGDVAPGTYTGSFHDENLAHEFHTPEFDYTYTLTIEADRSIELREVSRNCSSGKTETILYRGSITKYVETYNGDRKVWYGIEATASGMATFRNLSTYLVLTPGNCDTYQWFSQSLKDHKSCRLR